MFEFAMSTETIQAADFLVASSRIPAADVRTPLEYEKGHIPGAALYPIFSNEERAEIGKLYAMQGKDIAVRKGLEMVGPRMGNYVEKALEIAPHKEILLYCWRGGMRSASIAWLLDLSGFKVKILNGGYKGYRRYIQTAFKESQRMSILGGYTGSGKTRLLEDLYDAGEQVIDLEALASHKGSTFGWIGENQQPTQEQFENELGKEWIALDRGKTVWIEDESINIGQVQIPRPFFLQMQASPMVLIKRSFEARVGQLVRDYSRDTAESLILCFQRIQKRMGSDIARKAISFVEQGNLSDAAMIALEYYDKTYESQMRKRTGSTYRVLDDQQCGIDVHAIMNTMNAEEKSRKG